MDDLPFQAFEERQVVVVHPGERQVHLFNEVGSRIWELLERECTERELTDCLADEYDAGRGLIAREVKAFLAQLEQKGLVSRGGR